MCDKKLSKKLHTLMLSNGQRGERFITPALSSYHSQFGSVPMFIRQVSDMICSQHMVQIQLVNLVSVLETEEDALHHGYDEDEEITENIQELVSMINRQHEICKVGGRQIATLLGVSQEANAARVRPLKKANNSLRKAPASSTTSGSPTKNGKSKRGGSSLSPKRKGNNRNTASGSSQERMDPDNLDDFGTPKHSSQTQHVSGTVMVEEDDSAGEGTDDSGSEYAKADLVVLFQQNMAGFAGKPKK